MKEFFRTQLKHVGTERSPRKTYNGFIKAVIPKAHVGKVNALMPAPAGDVFWSGGDDGWIREWEADHENLKQTKHRRKT